MDRIIVPNGGTLHDFLSDDVGSVENLIIDDDYCDDIHTEYFSINDAKTHFSEKRKNDLCLIHLNISSLPANFNKLNNLLADLEVVPDVIALTETKITETTNNDFSPTIHNYSFINICSKTHSGGVGMFIRDTLNYSLRKDLCRSEMGQYETIWVDILSNSKKIKKFTFGVVYRHPGLGHINSFADYFESVLGKLEHSKSKYFVCGDFNINALLWQEYPIVSAYIDRVYACHATQVIDMPTRFPYGNQNGRPSLIDHLYTNTSSRIEKIGLILSDITDHLPIITILRTDNRYQKFDNFEYVRDFNTVNIEDFNNSIKEFDIFCDPSWNVDLKFEKLQDHIRFCVDKHAPRRKKSKREIKFRMNPWISRGLKKSIDRKNKMYNDIHSRNQLHLKPHYNKLKKKLEKLTWLAQRSYYSKKIDTIKGNSKILWKTINKIVSRKSKKGVSITHLKSDTGEIIYEPKQIANELNEYFVKVGKKLSDKISPPTKSHRDFLKGPPVNNTFFLSATNPFEVESIVSSFDNNKAMGPDNIPIRMLKAGLPVLSLNMEYKNAML